MRPEFYCGIGIENGWMVKYEREVKSNIRTLDVFSQMDHYSKWESDLILAADLGINAIRYSIPWYKSNPQKGAYDWEWIEKPIEWLLKHNIIPVIDLIHYGTPMWIENGVLNSSFPDWFMEYTYAFAEHFKGLIDHYTPVNEPQTSAMLSGFNAEWPPYLSGPDGWCKVSCNVGKAVVKSSRALRETVKDVVLISSDCFWSPTWEELNVDGKQGILSEREWMLLEYMAGSLAYGKIEPDSTLWRKLQELGVSEIDLVWFINNAQLPDIFGLNFYPIPWPDNAHGVEEKKNALIDRCRRVYKEFKLPIFITETSGGFSDDQKISWVKVLEDVYSSMKKEGVPFVGMNWWPLFETIQWDYRHNGKSIEECIVPGGWNNGLYVINSCEGKGLMRESTSAVKAYKDLIAHILKDKK